MDPEFLGLEDVLVLHARQIEAFGGTLGIRDRGLLESALAMPSATFGGQFVHEAIFLMAATYAFHVAENQPFLDGNNGPASARRWSSSVSTERRLDKAGLAGVLERLAQSIGE